MTKDIKVALDTYMKTNWTNTGIQYDGLDKIIKNNIAYDYKTQDSFISLSYVPTSNNSYGFGSSNVGRVEYGGVYKVFCYDRNIVNVLTLADSIKTLLSGIEIGDIHIGLGQDRTNGDMLNGYYEVICTFDVSQWA